MSTRHTRFPHSARFRHSAIVAAVLAATLAIHPAQARDAQGSKRGGAGFVSGAAVGAAAAGPLGMVVGGVVGGLMGERSQKKSEALAARKAESAKLAADLETLNLTLTEIESKAAAMGSTVQFRTGQTAVRDSDKARVARLGALVADIPDVRVRISGFADARGDDALNEALSQERAEMVARELEKAGVPRERLIIEALGERFASVESSSDDQAFERSVEIRFESTASLAMQ
jgi:outer membrane protein OmpA-like peptidoglycan-associated protein